MYRILIAVPTADNVHARTAAFCEYQAMRHKDGIVIDGRPAHFDSMKSIDRPIDYNRNQVVRYFLSKSDWTHLFFLDSDVEPPLDAIDRLLSLNAPIATGVYPVMMTDGLRWAILEQTDGAYRCLPRLPSAQPFEVDGAGGGCLLIRRDVLVQVGYPWFLWGQTPDGKKVGEDVFFCKRVNDLGLRISVDPTVLCHHYKTTDLLAVMRAFQE